MVYECLSDRRSGDTFWRLGHTGWTFERQKLDVWATKRNRGGFLYAPIVTIVATRYLEVLIRPNLPSNVCYLLHSFQQGSLGSKF